MSILGLAMVLSMSSDMLINGYYRNFRGSFYAADSGLSVARAQLLNQTSFAYPNAPVTFFASPPLSNPSSTTTAVLAYLTTNYGSFSSLNSGTASNSWAESFEVANTATCTNTFSLAPGYPIITATNSNGQATGYRYIFNYNLCVIGKALASEQVTTSESGSITSNITVQTSTSQGTATSFAAFGAFIDNYPPCLAPLIPGTFTGPSFTNGAWQFTTGGSYIFTDPVGQAQADADYWFAVNCIQSPTSSFKRGSQTIKPNFQGGLNLAQTKVPLPANDFGQKWAVLDGKGQGEKGSAPPNPPPAPTNTDLNAVLKNISGTAYPTSGASSGVYLPYSSVSGTNTITGGGIYVEGSASVQLSTGTDGSGNATQVYAITQGGTTTTITTDTVANTTTVKAGSTTLNLAGIPLNLVGNSPQPGTMLYVDGTISGLRGPGQGQAAIQDGTALTITANGNVDVTGDVIYKTEPVTTTQNQIVPGTSPACCNGTPVDTLIPGHDNNQVLGIFTATGNVNLNSPYSNKNLEVDGSIATIGASCASNSCGFTVSGSIDTFSNIGGQIQSNIFSANMKTQNEYFDRRFTSRAGFAPPWFPSTTVSSNDITNGLPPLVTQTVQRVSWVTAPQ